MLESQIEALVTLAASQVGMTLFRNNVATAYQGNVKRLSDNSIHIQNPRIIHAGLFKGSADEIGYTCITITPEMVGRTVAVFSSVEVKSGSKLRPEQITWLNRIIKVGGIAGVARSPEDIQIIISQFKNNLK